MISVSGRKDRSVIRVCRDRAEAEAIKAAMLAVGYKNVRIDERPSVSQAENAKGT
jgi:hypothetical protein